MMMMMSPDQTEMIDGQSQVVRNDPDDRRSMPILVKRIGHCITGTFPILKWLGHYSFRFLLGDLFAGLYIGLYQIPQCMAYSMIAGYPPTYLLWTNIFASAIYAVIGGHRRASFGVFSLVSAVYLSMILARSSDSTGDHRFTVSTVTFVTGTFSVMIGLFRLGKMVRFLPYEILSAFRCGIHFLLVILLVNPMLEMIPTHQAEVQDVRRMLMVPHLIYDELYPQLTRNQINWYSVAISAGCFGVLAIVRLLAHYWKNLFGQRSIWLKQIWIRVPLEFILVVIGILVAIFVDLHRYHLHPVGNGNGTTVGAVPEWRHITVAVQDWDDFRRCLKKTWLECITAALMFLFHHQSLAVDQNLADTEYHRDWCPSAVNRRRQIRPKRLKCYRFGWRSFDINHEMMAKGLIDIVGSLFHFVPAGSSRIRSVRMRNVGGCSQIAGLISSAVTMAIWWPLHQYLTLTPRCIIASIVAFDTAVAFGHELYQLPNYWRISVLDAFVWLLAFSSFVLFNIELSLYCCLCLSLLVYCYRSKIFADFIFKREKILTINRNSTILVPECLLDSDWKTADDNDSDQNIFNTIPASTLATLQIYTIDRHYLTLANMESFVVDVFRKMHRSIESAAPVNRLIFDCRSLSYLDWPSIRLIRSTVLRTIEIIDSWQTTGRYRLQPDQPDKSTKKPLIIVAFVLRFKWTRLIHQAGNLNVHFYDSMHQALHIGLKGAVSMVIGFPNNRHIDDDHDNNNDGGNQHLKCQDSFCISVAEIKASPSPAPPVPNRKSIGGKKPKQSKKPRRQRATTVSPPTHRIVVAHDDDDGPEVAVLPISFTKRRPSEDLFSPAKPPPPTSNNNGNAPPPPPPPPQFRVIDVQPLISESEKLFSGTENSSWIYKMAPAPSPQSSAPESETTVEIHSDILEESESSLPKSNGGKDNGNENVVVADEAFKQRLERMFGGASTSSGTAESQF